MFFTTKEIYNNHKNLILRCNFGEYSLQTTSISPDGNGAVAVSAVAADNTVSSVLNIYHLPEKEPVHTETIVGEYPISAHYLQGSVVLFTDKNIRFFNNICNYVHLKTKWQQCLRTVDNE